MLRVLEPGAFNGLKIKSLSINNANIERLDARTFAGLNLENLDLASNGIKAIADLTFTELICSKYIEVDEYWRNSAWCHFAGVIATISSEASVLFMCLITIDRVLVIKFPFGQYRFSTLTSTASAAVAWFLAVLIALVPVLHTDHFHNKFYSKSGVCLALPLTRDRPPGWLYSVIIFIGFNMITFTLISAGQLLIYAEVRKHNMSKKRLNMTRNNELTVARNLLLIVGTDFICWFPIGLMGLLALSGHVIPGEMYAWTAVLILPINSALNPFMYTFSAIISAKNIAYSATVSYEAEDCGKVIMDVLPYFIQKILRSSRAYILEEVLQKKSFSAFEIAYIIHNVTSYTNIVHENGLVFDGQITAENIVVQLNSDSKISSKATIMGIPSISTKRAKKIGHAHDDIYDVGKLIERLLKNVVNSRTE
ncbi:uncharacterized protein LOC132716059 [Ruditapes philippinarum]|uniref:uncharacterized protein LOC132716059 n=1 Tax=Ruditapes philippinarum TaxID=129788 RepID=UPI00295B2A30|nr:uncharacterized protein LOC132716059 [Ruditapes philippinarum]